MYFVSFFSDSNSASVSFFPKSNAPEERQTIKTHNYQPQFFQSQYPTISQQEEQFKFSNQKRIQDSLNENEIVNFNTNFKAHDFPLKKYRRIPLNYNNDPNSITNIYQNQIADNYQQGISHQQQQQQIYHQQNNQQPNRFQSHGQYNQNKPNAGQYQYNRPEILNPSNYGGYYQSQGDITHSQPSFFGNIIKPFQFNNAQSVFGGQQNDPQNFFNNLQNNGGNFGGQLGKALEDISRNDDYQCVPKLLCQMVGNPRGQSSLPSFVNAPTLTA